MREKQKKIVKRPEISKKKAKKFFGENELLRSLLNAVPESAFLMSIDGIILWANITAAQRMGIKAEEINGRSVFDFLEPDVVLLEKIYIEDAIRTGKSVSFDTEKDGKCMKNHIQPVLSENDDVKILAVYNYDFTSRKSLERKFSERNEELIYANDELCASEEELRLKVEELQKNHDDLTESELKFREIITFLDEAYYSCTTDGILLDHNQAFNRIFGFDASCDLKGEKLPDFWQNGDERDEYLKEITNNGLIKNYQINMLKSGGEKITVLVNSHLVKDKMNKPVRIDGTIIDITSQKYAEEELKKSEAFLNNIFEQSPYGYWISDDKGTLIRINKACCDMLKVTADDVVGKYNVIDDNIVQEQGLLPLVNRVFNNGETVRFEITYNTLKLKQLRLQKEALVVLDTTIFPIKDSAGRVTKAVIQHMDITARKLAYEALQESEMRFKQMAKSSPLPIIIFDKQEKIEFLNERFIKNFGYTLDDIHFVKDWWQLAYPDREYRHQMIDAWNEAVKKATKEGKDIEATMGNITCKDGSVKSIEIIGTLIGNKNLVIFNDITERKLAENALRASEERFNTFMEASPAVTWIKDKDGRYLYMNKAWEEAFGFKNEDLIGKTEFELLDHDIAAAIREDDLKVLEADRPVETIEITGKSDGNRNNDIMEKSIQGGQYNYWKSVKFSFLDASRRQLLGGIAIDITDRMRADEEIRKLNSELELRVQRRTAELAAINKELESFAYSVSHDLRAPLRGIDGWSLALLEDYGDRLDDRAREYLNFLRSETQRMTQIIEALLQLSRVGRKEMQRVTVDLSSLGLSVEKDIRKENTGRDVNFIIEPGMKAEGDEFLLQILLWNLFSNAWKFTVKQEHAKIEFSTDRSAEKTTYYIRDNGVGFDMNYVSKLFTPFQRLHSIEDYPGTGIGLATVQRIINRHGGSIWAQGETGKGAVFYFTL